MTPNPDPMSAAKDSRVVQSSLTFNSRCEEAVEFYRKIIGAGWMTLVPPANRS